MSHTHTDAGPLLTTMDNTHTHTEAGPLLRTMDNTHTETEARHLIRTMDNTHTHYNYWCRTRHQDPGQSIHKRADNIDGKAEQ